MNAKPYLFAAAALFATVSVNADERVDLRQAPAAVQRAVESAGSASAVKEVTKKTVDGRTVYDVEFERNNAINPRLRIAEDGTVLRENRAASDTSRQVSDDARAARDNVRDETRTARDNVRDETRALSNDTRRAARAAEGEMSAAAARMSTKLEDIPAAARTAIQAQAQGRDIVDIDKETWNGQTVYEVEFRQSGRNAQLHIAEDGTIVKQDNNNAERGMSTSGTTSTRRRGLFLGTQLEDTPAAVQDTIRREVGERQIVDIDKELRTGRAIYEVEVKDAEGRFQLHIAEDGTIVKDDRTAKR